MTELSTNNNNDNNKLRSPQPQISVEKCPICLSEVELRNRSLIVGCYHTFCFDCIKEWSKKNAVCPLCKQKFKQILYNIRADNDYGVYELSSHPVRPIQRVGDLWFSVFRFPTEPEPSRSTSTFRRQVYSTGLWAKGIDPKNNQASGTRHTSAKFYSKHPACCHRLAPWLNRELNALLRQRGSCVVIEDVMQKILDLIKVHDMTGAQFYKEMTPIFKENTPQFIHEFFHFAKSPFDMEMYDKNVIYSGRSSRAQSDYRHYQPVDNSSENHDTEDATLIPSTSHQSHRNNNNKSKRCTATSAAKSNSTGSSSSDILVPSTSSSSSVSIVNLISPKPSTSKLSKRIKNHRNVLTDEMNTHPINFIGGDSDDDDEDKDDDEVKVVGVEKPWVSRSPLMILSSSDDDDGDNNDITVLTQKQQPDIINKKSINPSSSSSDDDNDGDDLIQVIKVIKPRQLADNRPANIKTSISINGFQIQSSIKIKKTPNNNNSTINLTDSSSSLSSPPVISSSSKWPMDIHISPSSSSSSSLSRSSPAPSTSHTREGIFGSKDVTIIEPINGCISNSKKIAKHSKQSNDDDDIDDDDEMMGRKRKKMRSQIGYSNLSGLFKKDCKGHKNSLKNKNNNNNNNDNNK